MYCTKCGNELPDDAQFCENCGMSINQDTEKETNGVSSFGQKVDGIIGWAKEAPKQTTAYQNLKKMVDEENQYSQTGRKRKESVTSAMAFVLAFMPFTSLIGFCLAIIDLKNNDGTESHTGSKLALWISIILMIIAVAFIVTVWDELSYILG